MIKLLTVSPNQPPEPTAVLSAIAVAEADGAGCHRTTGSAVAIHAASWRWCGFPCLANSRA